MIGKLEIKIKPPTCKRVATRVGLSNSQANNNESPGVNRPSSAGFRSYRFDPVQPDWQTNLRQSNQSRSNTRLVGPTSRTAKMGFETCGFPSWSSMLISNFGSTGLRGPILAELQRVNIRFLQLETQADWLRDLAEIGTGCPACCLLDRISDQGLMIVK